MPTRTLGSFRGVGLNQQTRTNLGTCVNLIWTTKINVDLSFEDIRPKCYVTVAAQVDLDRPRAY